GGGVGEGELERVLAGGPSCDPENVRGRRFLDSFAITDTTLLAKQENRRADEQRAAESQRQAELVAKRAQEKRQAEERAAFEAFVNAGQDDRPIPAGPDLPRCPLHLPLHPPPH